jgi:hypothetical protein
MIDDDKARENRARRKAAHQGLTLRKTRRRDRDAPDYNVWRLYRTTTHGNLREIVSGDLATIEQHLSRST